MKLNIYLINWFSINNTYFIEQILVSVNSIKLLILTFGSELIKSSEYILHFVNFVNGTKFCASEELQNLDLDSNSSFTSQELAHFDR